VLYKFRCLLTHCACSLLNLRTVSSRVITSSGYVWLDTSREIVMVMVKVNLYSAVVTKSNALSTLVAIEKPGFQVLSKGLIVMLCTEVIRLGVPDHGALHSKCSAANSG